jgi:hypothetical protein
LTGIAILENLGAPKDSWISQRPISLGKTFGPSRTVIAGLTTERTES